MSEQDDAPDGPAPQDRALRDPAPRIDAPHDDVPRTGPAAAAPRSRAALGQHTAAQAGVSRRPALGTMAALAIGAVFGALATMTWQSAPSSRAVTGEVAAIDETGSAIALDGPDDLDETGFGVVGVLWRDGDAGEWQRSLSPDGFPTCLSPDDEGRTVRLGLVTEPGGTDRPASQVVAWLECGPRLASGAGS